MLLPEHSQNLRQLLGSGIVFDFDFLQAKCLTELLNNEDSYQYSTNLYEVSYRDICSVMQ